MTVAYVELSALVKLALTEDHSVELRDAIRENDRVTSELSILEVGRALRHSDGEAGLARARTIEAARANGLVTASPGT